MNRECNVEFNLHIQDHAKIKNNKKRGNNLLIRATDYLLYGFPDLCS